MYGLKKSDVMTHNFLALFKFTLGPAEESFEGL